VSERKRLPRLRTFVLGFASLVLVVASLGIDQTAPSRSDAHDLGFGYPLHFASADVAALYGPASSPRTYKLNPWEMSVEGNAPAFFVSWILVYVALLSGWLLARTAFRAALRRHV
jgi:hypothetical protein